MTNGLQKAREALAEVKGWFKVGGITITGSCLFGDYCEGSDIDLLIFAPEIPYAEITSRGYTECGEYGDSGDFFIVRNAENVNLIITNSIQKHILWMKCEQVSMRLNLGKAGRKTLFSTFIDDGGV